MYSKKNSVTCRILLIGVSKTGSCPELRGPAGICEELCAYDSDCPGDQKCCGTGCGHTCQELVTRVEPHGSCPMPGLTAEQCSVVRYIPCRGDSECTGSQKCCFNGCGYACQNPIQTPRRETCAVRFILCNLEIAFITKIFDTLY